MIIIAVILKNHNQVKMKKMRVILMERPLTSKKRYLALKLMERHHSLLVLQELMKQEVLYLEAARQVYQKRTP